MCHTVLPTLPLYIYLLGLYLNDVMVHIRMSVLTIMLNGQFIWCLSESEVGSMQYLS